MHNKGKKIIISACILLFILLILLILYSFFGNINKNDVVFILSGNHDVEIQVNEIYNEQGFKAYFKNGDDLSKYVTIESNINSNMVGIYQIKYLLNYKNIRKELIRIVKVLDNSLDDISLELIGEDVVYLLKNTLYEEKGIKAIDTVDGDISENVIIKNSVDNKYNGEYLVNYEIVNSRDVKKSITRKVIVYDFDYDLKITKTTYDTLNLVFLTNSDLIDCIYINDKKIKGKSINIDILDNQEYLIYIVDIYGNKKEEYFDFLSPNLTCTAVINDNGIIINAKAYDNKKIKNYNYYINGIKYNSDLSVYNSNICTKDIVVEVYDDSNNSKKVKCAITDNVKVFDSGLKNSVYNNWLYYLYVPENVKKYEKMPLIVFLHGSDERGKNLRLLENYGFAKYIKNGKKYNAFILIPQLPSAGTWRSGFDKLISLIDTVKQQYNIDSNRISVSGFSLGAGDIANGMEKYNNYFSSAVLIAPGGRGSSYAKYFVNIPTQVFNGSNDSYSYNSTTKGFVDTLKSLGGEVTYTTYNGLGHNVVDKVFENGIVVEWMISKIKK